MHRSLKEGRWCNHAPFGYMNRRDEAGKPMMVIDEVKAPIIAQVFSDFINDVPPREILSRARKSGFTPKGHSALERVVTNPIYAGMIKVFAYRQEPERIIRGVHGAIISEGIYYAALDKWNAQSAPKPRLLTKELMLRGVVLCDGCGKPLTGGRSKGRSGRHWWYYRCLGCAGHNYSAIEAHGNLHRILNAMSLTTDRVDEFIAAVDRELKQLMKDQESEAVKLRNKLVKLESELNSLEEKYIQEKVAFDTYQKHYPIYRREIASLKKASRSSLSVSHVGISERLGITFCLTQSFAFSAPSLLNNSKRSSSVPALFTTIAPTANPVPCKLVLSTSNNKIFFCMFNDLVVVNTVVICTK